MCVFTGCARAAGVTGARKEQLQHGTEPGECIHTRAHTDTQHVTACVSSSGVLQSGDPVQAGRTEGRSDQKKHLLVSGCMQGVPVQTGLQEEEGTTP